MKKVGKTTGPFRYDLNQTPYDYTEEVRNRFKGLDLIDRVPNDLWTEVHDIVQEAVIKIIPKEKNGKMAVWGGLSHLFFSQLFVRPPQIAILLLCISFSWGWS